MKSSKSPFKKLSHSREGSTDEHSSFLHKRSISGSSMHIQSNHSRNVSGNGSNAAPPVSGVKSSHKRNISNSSRSSQNSNFLAEQYERDRKAIIASCFSTQDSKVSAPPNCYVTHVRVIEDAKSPSSRPPVDSKLENKKKRVLIISSKANNTNKIQLHKGRENSDGGFQIGRTWDLKELTRIERDSDINEGFTFIMGKQYYWETNSAKERTVFMKSLINTYMQAFDGHVPELVNWDLSMFYLDERSYQRAVIRQSVSSSKATATTQDPVFAKPNESANLIPTIRSPERGQRILHKKEQPSPNNMPTTKSLNKAPYTNSPTINEVSRRYDKSENREERHEQTREIEARTGSAYNTAGYPSMIETASGTTSQSSLKSASQPRNTPKVSPPPVLHPNQQQLQTSPLGKDTYLAQEESGQVESKTDHLLEDLNNVLGSSQELSETPADISDEKGQLETKVTYERDVTPASIAKVESLTVKASFDPIALDEEILDLNATISDDNAEDTNDLSFERGDEVRFSQVIEPDSSHMYHEVSTIQEEAPVMVGFQYDDESKLPSNDKMKRSSKKSWDFDDEELLEVLADINWAMDDDASTLIEKLNAKMAETEYSFNKGLLSLEQLGSSLLPYERNIDKECDNMNPTVSLFLMEMSNVAEDIEYVESQKNGLQVESANKKLLWSTLTELMNTVSLDDENLRILLNSPVTEKNLVRMERQLNALFKALKAISGEKNKEGYNLGEMKALKQRRETYEKVTKVFLERLVQEMTGKFSNICKDDTSEERLASFLTRLLCYSSLTLFCKNISPESYSYLIERWNTGIFTVYNKMCNEIVKRLEIQKLALPLSEQRSMVNQPGLAEFISQWEHYRKTKTSDSKATTSNALVVKLRDSIETVGKWCIFYQNFIDAFFHISSKLDFEQYVDKYHDPSTRIIPLNKVKSIQSDRDSALIEIQLVSRIFQPLVAKIASCFTNLLKCERSIAPALMIALEQKIKSLESSNAEFLMTAVSRIFAQVKQIWLEYVDEQVVFLERATVNFSSRTISPSVIGLPLFVKNSQDLIIQTQHQIGLENTSSFETIELFESACGRLSSAVAKFLARKDTNSVLTEAKSSRAVSEDVDRAITLLMNCDWLFEVLDMVNSKGIFDPTLQTAKKIFDSEKDVYAACLLRDAMPKLTSFIYGASNLIGTSSSGGTNNPSKWAAYSKHNLENILIGYTSNEIEVLVKRLYDHMMDHFSNEPNKLLKEVLCDKLWSCIQGHTVSLYLKLYTLIEKHYKGTYVKFTKNDIITAFERYKK